MLKKSFLTKWQLCELKQFFQLVFVRSHACASDRAKQLLPQPLMEQFDTLNSDNRHIRNLHEDI